MTFSIVLLLVVIVFIIGSLSNKNRCIQKLLNKKSNYSLNLTTELSKKYFEKAVYIIAKDFTYNIEFINTKNNQYILSDRIGLHTWGFYYLFEYNNDEINLYLTPRFWLEIEKFGIFKNKLARISALYHLVENYIAN